MRSKTMETSKRIVFLIAGCFIVSLLYTIIMFTYSVIADKNLDFTVLITIITTTGALLCGAVVFYYNKARVENVYKIKKSFLREKYGILKEAGMLSPEYAQQELMNDMQVIESKLDEEEEKASVETETNLSINL